MFYDSRTNDHGLPHDPFKALVGPRPIGWISTRSKAGISNLAPYSFFNAIATQPNLVMFSSQGHKDSVTNIEETGVFACSMVSHELRDVMNKSSAPVDPDVSEFELAGLTEAPCQLIDAPYVAEAPAALECRLLEVVRLNKYEGVDSSYEMVIGEVIGIHIKDEMLVDGKVDAPSMQLLSRLGYMDYATVNEVFSLSRPKD
ncbi:flavin reductase family protein [Cohaesibacter sp. CAU 1516]|uniref:flavin reductase family protein n=1 Tax=Cohaesibacter sp. CAU 1516 TaxID=2576038 RepID=UPI0010FDE45A|nr:flavin reductase family protein [Cohaesibacter sp. CAU 1516]TLP48654.1 flavin reductase family protein [Cohaesibacter sp. CAU 1516]